MLSIFFKGFLLILIYGVYCQHSIHTYVAFRYFPFAGYRMAGILTSGNWDCYICNTTNQTRHDAHDPVKLLEVEGRLMKMMLENDTFFVNSPKTRYDHDLKYFQGPCNHGKANLWTCKDGHLL